MANKPVNWKKILQAGAIATDAFSKGSTGGLGKTLAESDLDFSGMFKKGQSGASNGAVDIPPTSGITEDAAGRRFGGQGNKRRKPGRYADDV